MRVTLPLSMVARCDGESRQPERVGITVSAMTGVHVLVNVEQLLL
jgi:hypothetical protein